MVGVEIELDRQSAQTLATPIVRHSALAETGLDMLFVDRCHQPSKFAPQDRRILEVTSEQQRLKPAVQVLHGAIALWATLRDEDGRDAQAETPANHARQIPGGLAPAAELASVVELHLGG